MSNDLEFAVVPAVDLRAGDHLCDSRIPFDNEVSHVRVLEDGRVIVLARKRSHDPRAVSYRGGGLAFTFRPHTLTEVWDYA